MYLYVVQKVLDEVHETLNATNADFISEIVNMIYAQAKIILNQSGHNFEKVLPQVTLAPPIYHSPNITILIPISTNKGIVDIKIQLQKKLAS